MMRMKALGSVVKAVSCLFFFFFLYTKTLNTKKLERK